MSAAHSNPPGNALGPHGAGRVAPAEGGLAAGVLALLARVREETAYNDAKGATPYRLGMHDGLRFVEDALLDLLRAQGIGAADEPPRAFDA